MDFNKVIVTGRIAQEPELKMAGDREYCGFQIAINRYKDTGVDFVKVATFGHTAEFVSQYVNKGDLLLVEGRLQNNEWQGQDGVKRRSTEIIANTVQLMRKKNQSNEAELPPSEVASDITEEILEKPVENDEIPF